MKDTIYINFKTKEREDNYVEIFGVDVHGNETSLGGFKKEREYSKEELQNIIYTFVEWNLMAERKSRIGE